MTIPLRERRRADTVAEIKAIALAHLAAGGPDALSLRAVARGNRAWKLCELSQMQLEAGKRNAAIALAREAVMLKPTTSSIRWLAKALRSRGIG